MYSRSTLLTLMPAYWDFVSLAWKRLLLTILHRYALAGRQASIVMYSMLLGFIALSTFEDVAAAYVTILLRTYFLCWLFYSFPFARARFGRFLHAAALDQNAGYHSPRTMIKGGGDVGTCGFGQDSAASRALP